MPDRYYQLVVMRIVCSVECRTVCRVLKNAFVVK